LRYIKSAGRKSRCDLLFGCIDEGEKRRDLEAVARRYLNSYIDIGLDVHQAGTEPPVMASQVMLSIPGSPCLHCLGVLPEKALAHEDRCYGDAEPRPQVAWANGVLAAMAVGIAVDLLTSWTGELHALIYLEYFGNKGTVLPSPRLACAAKTCVHYPTTEVGDSEL
jgi:hypothetical protein